METILTIFKALSDETRLKILKLLENGELCVCDLFTALDMSQPKVSFHLGVLKEAGIIKDRKQGKWIHYTLDTSDLFRRFLILSVLEKTPVLKEETRRLEYFLRNKNKIEKTSSKRSCVKCRG
jgi:ArsR family transcriptional regulator